MAMVFDRQEIKRWEALSEWILIDWKTTMGKGSYGTVHKGYSRVKDSLIAIKNSRREIETLKALSSLIHPNIMGYYGEIELNNNIFLLLEYCNGGTLTELIKKGIPEARVLKLFRQLVEGMCYMNARQKMHRDFKPDNILIGPQGDIKIADFGLSQNTNSIFVTGRMGTPIYAGPEVFLIHNQNEQTYTYTCDVWSAGLILYEMLKGQSLLKDVQNYTQLKHEWLLYQRGLKRAVVGAPFHPLWDYFVSWMLQFDYQKRPTFHSVLQNLKKVYDRMLSHIQGKVDMIQQLGLGEAQQFIHYQVGKYQVLVMLCEKFTAEDIRINNEYKYICMLLCLLRYTHFARTFIRALRYRRIRLETRELMPQSELPEMEMLCDRARFPLEHRCDFYSKQLRNTIVAKIQDKYCRRPESRHIMAELAEMVQVVEKVARNEVLPDDEEINKMFIKLVPIIRRSNCFRKWFSEFTEQELRLYAHLLIVALLEEKFPEGDFARLDPEKQVEALAGMRKEELNSLIEKMHEEIDH